MVIGIRLGVRTFRNKKLTFGVKSGAKLNSLKIIGRYQMSGGPKLSELKLDEKEWPEIRRLKASARRGWEYAGMLLKEIYKNYGGEGVEKCFNSVMIQQAEKYFFPGLKKFNIKGNDCRTVAAYFMLADLIVFPGFSGFEVIEDSPKRVVLRGYQCPFTRDPAKDLAGVCEHGYGNEATACRLLNPKIKYSNPKLMNRGDPYCELVFEMED